MDRTYLGSVMSSSGQGLSRGAERHDPARPPIARPRPWVRLGIWAACLAGLAGALLSIRPALKAFQEWQAGNLLSQAGELARQQLFSEAISRLDMALKLDPASTDALRLLATIYTRFELPYALPVWQRLIALPGHTEKDVHTYTDLALRLQRYDIAETELSKLLAHPKISAETRMQACEFFFRQGDFPRALQFAQQLRENDPTNRLFQLRVAEIRLGLPTANEQRKGTEALRSMGALDIGEVRSLLRTLSSSDELPGPEVKSLLSSLALPPSAEPEDYFLRADAVLRLSPEERSATVAAALARFQDGTPAERAALAAWLNKIGDSNKVLQIIHPGDLPTQPAVAVAYLEALARSERWKQMEETLAADLPLETWHAAALKATAAEHRGQVAFAREQWRRAFEDVSGSPGKERALGELALRMGSPDRAVQAFNDLTGDRLTRLLGYRLLAGVYEKARDSRRLRLILREWSSNVSDDPVPENAFCYLSGLLSTDVELAYQRAKRLQERLPRRLTYRTTLALLQLRRGEPGAALELFDRTRLDVRTMSPQSRLIYAAVLNANGREAQARAVVEGLDASKLLHEEGEILRQIQESKKKEGGRGA